MARVTIPTVTANQAVRASWGNIVKGNDEDHETRLVAVEGAVGDVDNTEDVTLAGTPNYITIVGQVITRALIDLASHVTGRLPWANATAVTAASRLLGRGSSGGSGDVQEISLGAGLSMSGTTLSATGGGGGGGALDDLTDVAISTPSTDQVVKYDGSGWVNGALPNHSAALLTSGTVPDARFPATLPATSGVNLTALNATNVASGTLDVTRLGTTGAPQFGRVGIGAAADANSKLKIAGDYWSPTVAAGNSSTSKTLDWRDGNTQLLTLTGNCTLTLSNPQDGGRYLIALKQDGTGSRTVTWPSSVKWSAGTAPTLTTSAGLVDVVTLVYFSGLGASGNYLAAASQNFTPA